jgi:hydroxymethylglutaryl-CoA lyase
LFRTRKINSPAAVLGYTFLQIALVRPCRLPARAGPIVDLRPIPRKVAMTRIKLIECPRDAWQGRKEFIPTAIKAAYLRELIIAGFKHLDLVSFVSPRVVPQMADAEDVLRALDLRDHEREMTDHELDLIGLTLNDKGAQRAIKTGFIQTLGFPYSVSPTFLLRNQNQTLEQASDELERIKQRADDNGLEVIAYISMAFGNPYGDLWSPQESLEAIGLVADMGIRQISLADTAGVATPELIGELFGAAIPRFDHLEIGCHLHSRPSQAREKVLAAFDAGCRRFDSVIGGYGGCPFAQDQLVGNIATGIVLEAMAERGAEWPVLRSLPRLERMGGEIMRHGMITSKL